MQYGRIQVRPSGSQLQSFDLTVIQKTRQNLGFQKQNLGFHKQNLGPLANVWDKITTAYWNSRDSLKLFRLDKLNFVPLLVFVPMPNQERGDIIWFVTTPQVVTIDCHYIPSGNDW